MVGGMKEELGFIGLGVMGAAMAGRLLDAGHSLRVFTRTAAKAEDLIKRGATWCGSPRELAAQCDVIFTIVGWPEDVRQVYLGPEGIVNGIGEGSIAVDMTTTEPSLEKEIGMALASKGAAFVDAPVSGGDKGARDGTLSIMAGGEDSVLERIRPYLELMGSRIIHCGPLSSGQMVKLCNQVMIAGTMGAMAEALSFAKAAGLDLQMTLDAISGGAAGCWSLDKLAPRILKGDYAPGFRSDHMLKDLSIAQDEASGLGLCLPELALVRQLYTALGVQGHGQEGTQALVKVYETLCGISFQEED